MIGLLTSFGLLSNSEHPSFFYRLPPLSATGVSSFGFDYAPLFFYDKLIIDEGGLARLREFNQRYSADTSTRGQEPLFREMIEEYRKVLTILDLLEEEGILVSRNFDSLVSASRKQIEAATLEDLQDPYAFCRPLLSSMEIWTSEITRMRSAPSQERRTSDLSCLVAHGIAASRSLDSSVIREGLLQWKKSQGAELRAEIRRLLKHYLEYINLNLLVARSEGASIIDWEDMAPIYCAKFTNTPNAHSQIASYKKTFQFFFPDWAPRSHKELMKVLKNPALREFKVLVAELNTGGEASSADILRILHEVIDVQTKTAFRRQVTGNAGKLIGIAGSLLGPIGSLVATGVAEGTERAVNKIWSDDPLDEFNWYFMINGIRASGAPTAERHGTQ